MESTGGPKCGVSSLANNVAAASVTNNCSHGTIAEYELMKGLKHGLTMKKKTLILQLSKVIKSNFVVCMGRKRRKLNSLGTGSRGTKQSDQLNRTER